MRVSIYTPLCDYFLRLKIDLVTLTFSEIEKITGKSLPQSALKYSSWWANDETHTQAKNGWMAAGWKSSDVNLGTKLIQFNRVDRT